MRRNEDFLENSMKEEAILDFREIKKRMKDVFGEDHVRKIKSLITEECRLLAHSTAFRNTHVKIDLYYCNRRIATFMGMSQTSNSEKWVEHSWRFMSSDNQGNYHESTIPICEIPLDTVMRISIVADTLVYRYHDFPLLHRRVDAKSDKVFQEHFKRMLENVPSDAVELRYRLLRNRDYAWRKGNHIFIIPSHGEDESFEIKLGFKLPWETPVYVFLSISLSLSRSLQHQLNIHTPTSQQIHNYYYHYDNIRYKTRRGDERTVHNTCNHECIGIRIQSTTRTNVDG